MGMAVGKGGGVMDKDKKRYIKWLCREIAKIDREGECLAKEKLELQLEMTRIGGKQLFQIKKQKEDK